MPMELLPGGNFLYTKASMKKQVGFTLRTLWILSMSLWKMCLKKTANSPTAMELKKDLLPLKISP